DRAALDPAGRASAAERIGVRTGIAVVRRIGIDEAADRAMLLRELRLEPAPAGAVAREDDLAANVDAALGERVIIVGHSEIDVNHGRGDVAVALVGDIRRQCARDILRRGAGVRWYRRLLPAERDVLG